MSTQTPHKVNSLDHIFPKQGRVGEETAAGPLAWKLTRRIGKVEIGHKEQNERFCAAWMPYFEVKEKQL